MLRATTKTNSLSRGKILAILSLYSRFPVTVSDIPTSNIKTKYMGGKTTFPVGSTILLTKTRSINTKNQKGTKIVNNGWTKEV